jgi:putative DNA primase/helicase
MPRTIAKPSQKGRDDGPRRIANIESEEAYLCGLVEHLMANVEKGRMLHSEGSVSLFTDQHHREIFLGLGDVFASAAPVVTDVPEAIRRYVIDPAACDATDPAVELFFRLSDSVANPATAGAHMLACSRHLLAIKEAHQRQRLADTAAEAAAAATAGRVSVGDMEKLEREVSRTKEVIANNRTSDRKLNLRSFDTIEAKPIEWLWRKRIVDGGLTILTGPVGNTKSLLSIDIAARVSLGSRWPDNTGNAPKGGVILFGGEDEAESVLAPRLIWAGADRSMIRHCSGAAVRGRDYDDPMKLEHDIGLLREALDEFPECRLIVFDPLSDYIDGDQNSGAEVRAAVMPLVKLAQDRKVAVLAVCHQTKKNELGAVLRIAGSTAFSQIARVIIAVGDDPEDETETFDRRRVAIVAKGNYGGEHTGQAYRLKRPDCDAEGVRLEWIDAEVVMRADELVRRPSGGAAHQEKRNNAVNRLQEILAAGEVPATEATAAMEEAGFGLRQIKSAVHALGVIKRKTRAAWCWGLPPAPDRFHEFDNWGPDSGTVEEWSDPFPKPR